MLMMHGEAEDGRRWMIIGLTEANRQRLPGHPIMVKGPHAIQVQDIFIVHGEDKPDIMRQLQEAGLDVPEVMMAAAAVDPQ